MGGKTGTAQKLPRSARKYLVSFIGSVPADNPQVAIYVVVDEANSEDQAHSYYAQSIAREILKEELPYYRRGHSGRTDTRVHGQRSADRGTTVCRRRAFRAIRKYMHRE